MPKKDISMIALVFFITRCFLNLYSFTNIYSYLIVVISMLIALIVIKKIKCKFKKNILLKWFYTIAMIIIFSIVLINSINFINMNYFRYENYFSTGLSLLAISYIIGKDEIKTISSISEIFLFIFILIEIMITLGLFSLIEVNNYIDFSSIKNVSISLYPFMLVIVLLYIKDNNIMTGYFMGVISSLIDIFLIVGSLGSKLPLLYSYPGISLLKSITFFHFLDHLDKLFSFIYLFEYTITLSFIINVIKNNIKKESI